MKSLKLSMLILLFLSSLGFAGEETYTLLAKDSTTKWFDSYLQAGRNDDYNFGDHGIIVVHYKPFAFPVAEEIEHGMIYCDVSGFPAASNTIDSAKLFLPVNQIKTVGDTCRVILHDVGKYWGEGDKQGTQADTNDVTWNDSLYGEGAWTTPGCDGPGDIKTLVDDFKLVDGGGTIPDTAIFDVTSSIIREIDSAGVDHGWRLSVWTDSTTNIGCDFYSKDWSIPPPGASPWLTVYYTIVGPPNVRKGPDGSGVIHGPDGSTVIKEP